MRYLRELNWCKDELSFKETSTTKKKLLKLTPKVYTLAVDLTNTEWEMS